MHLRSYFPAIDKAFENGSMLVTIHYAQDIQENRDIKFDQMPTNLERHTPIGYFYIDHDYDIDALLSKIFYTFQGEIWSPNGEAHDTIRMAHNVWHTSMSIGDVVEIGGIAYACCWKGWKKMRK